MAQEHAPPQQPAPGVVPRGEIPISMASENVGLEVRPLLAHQSLSRMLPPSAAALAWILAPHGREVGLRSHRAPSMLIVVQGTATLLGGTPRRIEKGDVVTIPREHEYGLTAIGADGLHAVHVVFGDDGPAREGAQSLVRLLERNEARAAKANGNVFFRRLQEAGLDGAKSSMLREVFRVLSGAFQAMLFMRQALCRDEAYGAAFEARFRERVAHRGAVRVPGDSRVATDPILNATASWFAYQVLNLDNAGKAVLHLVLETAHDHLRGLAEQVVSDDDRAEYLGALAGGDFGQVAKVVPLLEGHHPKTYRHLERVLEDAWDVFDAMTQRVAALVEREGSRS
jgi:quercetin dioxygenase-like cupin family protein